MGNGTGMIFLHGAGLNSSIWEGLKQNMDHPVLTVDFPNRTLKGNPNGKLKFDDYVDRTATEIKNWKKDNFIIVAHSIAACVGLKLVGQFKNELKGFVAIGSVIPKNGHSFVSSLPLPQKLLLPILLSLFGTKPPKNSIESELCNDLSPGTTSNMVNGFTPEAKALYTTRITFDLPDFERLYIKLTNDRSIPLDLQDKMAKNLNATQIETMDSGHLPMLGNPEGLGTILTGFMDRLEPK